MAVMTTRQRRPLYAVLVHPQPGPSPQSRNMQKSCPRVPVASTAAGLAPINADLREIESTAT